MRRAHFTKKTPGKLQLCINFIPVLIVFVRPMGCLVKKHTHILPNDGFMVIYRGTIRKKITKQQIINPSV